MVTSRRKLFLLTSAVALAVRPIALNAQIIPIAPAPSAAPATQPAGADAGPYLVTPRATTSPTSAPTTQVSLNFVDVPIDTILERLSTDAGFIIIKPGPGPIPGRATIRSTQPVSAEDAVKLLNTVLMNNGEANQHYTAIQMGRILKIETVEQARKGGIPVRVFDGHPKSIEPTDELVTYVLPLRTLDAPKLKTDLQPLLPVNADIASNAASNSLIITDTQANIRRIAEIVASMDQRDALENTIKVRQLQYADATAAAKLITDIFKPDSSSGANNANPFAGGPGAFFRGFGGGGPGGGGGGGGGGRGGGGGGGDSSDRGQTGKITASADTRTNTIVITGPTDTIAVIDKMLDQLDADHTDLQDFFMYRVKNGQAVDMQNTLNTLFGNSTTGGTTSSGGASTNNAFGTSSGLGGNGSAFGSSGSSRGGGGGGLGSSGSSGLGGSSFGQSSSTGNRGTTSTGNRGGGFGGSSGFGGGSSGGPVSPLADLKGQVYIVADSDTNSLLVATAKKYEDRIMKIILELDRPIPQVLIKCLVAEVSHDNNLDAGVDFSVLNLRPSGNGQTGSTIFGNALAATAANSTGAGGMIIKVAEDNFTATIRALQTVGKVDVLSRPYILASDNQQASILVGQEVPIITNSQTTDTGNVINNIQYQSIGIILNVTPHINPDGLVIMDVAPQISSISNSTVPIASNVNATVFNNRSAQSRVGIRDGETIVVGGLMQDQKTQTISKVPFLGDIPFLGLLFQRNQTDKTKTELLFFLTPHVAAQPGLLTPITQDELKGVKLTPNAVEPGAFQDHMQGMQRGTTQPSDIPEPTVPPVRTLPPPRPGSQLPEPALPSH